MSISIDELPTEIIWQILRLLNEKDLLACRLVNRRLFDLSNVPLDLIWRKRCQAAFAFSADDTNTADALAEWRRKSQYKLSWQQLHRSLVLCSHMSEAKITSQSKQLPKVENWKDGDQKMRHFTVLDNGLVATPVYVKKSKKFNDKVTDAVNNNATTSSKRKGGRPKTAKLIIDTAKTEASNSKKRKIDQQEVNIETGDTQTRKLMRKRSSNKNTVAQKQSMPNEKTSAQNTCPLLLNKGNLAIYNNPCCNTILYLDIDTLSEHHLETYDFEFNKYEETDKIIVFRSCQGGKCKLIIGYKVEEKPLKLHSVGAMRVRGKGYTDFFIVDDSVYYQDEDEILSKVFPKSEYGDKIPQMKKIPKFSVKNNEILREFHNNKMIIIGIVKVGDDTVNILTDNTETLDETKQNAGDAGRVYSVNTITGNVELLALFTALNNKLNRLTIHNQLRAFEFDFSEERVFAWLNSFVPLTKLKKTVVHRHDKIVIIGNTKKTLLIYRNAIINYQMFLYDVKPTLKIDLKKLENVQFNKKVPPGLKKMWQIDAIPTLNGVKILILIADIIVSVDLMLDEKP